MAPQDDLTAERAAKLQDYVYSLIIPVTESGCWLWEGNCNPKGYGRFMSGRKTFMAHRFVYELLKGTIPEGLQLDHLCRVHCCVNPAHLEPVTGRINTLRGIEFAAVNAAKTSCPQGHPYTPDNIKKCYPQRRNCLTCRREQHKLYMRRRKLDRLASEGAPSPIDLSSKFNDDGNHG